MDTLKAALFENPLWICVALAAAEIVLAAVWYERRTRKLAWALAAPPVLAGLAILLAWGVVTDRERILSIAREIADAVVAGDPAVIEEHLDEEFIGVYQNARLDRAAAVAACRREVRRYRITGIRLTGATIEVRGESAEMHVIAMMNFADGQAGARRTPVHFLVDWIKRPDGWKILGADDIGVGVR